MFYSEVGEYVNLSMKNPHHRTQLGDILCQISAAEHDSGRPLLSALVVHKKDKKPGGRFFDFARELGKQRRDENNDAFYANELKRVFDKWGLGEKAEAGFDTLDHAVTERQRRFAGGDDTLDRAQTIFGDQLYNGKLLAGQYRIIGNEPLGSGGMGEVWKAADTELGTTVAIKVLPPMMARDKAAIENLKREAMIGQQLTHQNICRLYGFHSEGKLKFIVMEFIDGQTLKEVLALRDDRKLTWEELEPIAMPVAEALDYAHNATYKDAKGRSVKGVLHRDIKPANIMVAKDGQAKLMDFGIAREIHNTMTQFTGRSSSLTPMYASPEQFRGEKMTAASDIYSFTAVLYECLAGHSYISPHGDQAYQILQRDFEPLTSQNQEINKVLKTGLAKETGERPKSASGLVEHLKAKPATVEEPKKPEQIIEKEVKREEAEEKISVKPQPVKKFFNKSTKVALIIASVITLGGFIFAIIEADAGALANAFIIAPIATIIIGLLSCRPFMTAMAGVVIQIICITGALLGGEHIRGFDDFFILVVVMCGTGILGAVCALISRTIHRRKMSNGGNT